MTRIDAQSPRAHRASEIITELQAYFVNALNEITQKRGSNTPFMRVEWFRDEGRHGGGVRYEGADKQLFNRGSVNYSQVHYDDDASKKLSSATAISTIIHPENPLAPSMHMHISWTEMRDGSGYWRIMADLNPSNPDSIDTEIFETALREAAGRYYDEGSAQGNRYFFIPALGRHRGVSHFYLENFNSGDEVSDRLFASAFGKKVIETYIKILDDAIQNRQSYHEIARSKQLDYHTLYLLQVLTLDRGTTSGLLIHDQNDIGIMGSLPSHVDTTLLQSWIGKLNGVQNDLLQSIVDALGAGEKVIVDEKMKSALAKVVRQHYQQHPNALALQACGEIIPTTVNNHR
ncbi:MAG TPA: coproporphyrinogen III oxidase [Sulfuricurvum sp.]|nr:coproporphyrinogen III oxidase [Sulfuricurvum sp.]